MSGLAAAGPEIIGKSRAGTYEDVVLRFQSFPQIDPTFHGDPVPEVHARLDEGVVANVAIIAYDDTVAHVGERPNSCPGPKTGSGFNQGVRVDHGFGLKKEIESGKPFLTELTTGVIRKR